MDNRPAPQKDPNLGTYTPDYARWAFRYLTDEDFVITYGFSKQNAHARCEVFPEYVESEPENELENDTKEVSDEPEKRDSEVAEETSQSMEVAEPHTQTQQPTNEAEDEKGNDSDEPNAEVMDDLENLHHKTFEKKYGISSKDYKTKHNL